MIKDNNNFVLTISCPDKIGIVSNVAGFLLKQNCNIIESAQFGDSKNGMFFMRVNFESLNNKNISLNSLEKDFIEISTKFKMESNFYSMSKKAKTIIMVSKFGHCLNNILFQWSNGHINIDIPCIISNHENLKSMVEPYNIPFEHIPINQNNKIESESKLLNLVSKHRVDIIILARYMQILSPSLCSLLQGKIINIHHSFLPSFKGARPYQQAFDKGVKIIGASAHYVTQHLDEGQIIEQDVARVNHANSLENFISIGRDIENLVLTRALKWHTEHRVLVNQNRTIVFY